MRSEITHPLKEKRHFVFWLKHAKLYFGVNRGDVLKAIYAAFVNALQYSKYCMSKTDEDSMKW